MAKKLFGKPHLRQVWLLGKGIAPTPGDFLRDTALKHLPPPPAEVGTSSNATLTTLHSQLNVHLAVTTLDLLSH